MRYDRGEQSPEATGGRASLQGAGAHDPEDAPAASCDRDDPIHLWLASRGVTKREQQVVKLLERRLTNPEIASVLSISIHTVHNQVASVFRRVAGLATSGAGLHLGTRGRR